MVKRTDGFWETTIIVLVDATQINFALNDGQVNWDNNAGGDWNVAITAADPAPSATVMSFPYVPVQGQQVKIIYHGPLADLATGITMLWGYNGCKV